MKGYKAFNDDLTCRGYQFTVNKTHTFGGTPISCVQGFHFCTDLQDVVNYYCSPTMRVFEIEATGIITDTYADGNCTKRACSEIRLVKELSLDEVMLSITKSKAAYEWTKCIGNRDIMINHITESKWAYKWALWIGNQDIMVNRITESNYAYYWAYCIGNIDIMINHITDSEYAYKWALDIGNRDIMIDRITDSEIACMWAYHIGNEDIMKSRVTESYWIDWWNIFL